MPDDDLAHPNTNDEKECSLCEQDKHKSLFGKRTGTRDGLEGCCKACKKSKAAEYYARNRVDIRQRQHDKYRVNAVEQRKRRKEAYHRDKIWENRMRNTYYLKSFGITVDDYNDMFIEQGGCCAVCGSHQNEIPKRLVVDHCHETGVVRGLLCSKCNLPWLFWR